MQKTTLLLICLASSLLATISIYLFRIDLTLILSNWIMDVSGYYLISNYTFIDIGLIGFIPTWAYISTQSREALRLKLIVKSILLFAACLLLSICLGICLAVVLWLDMSATSYLLPNYIKQQPFPYYWTVFELLGLIIPMLILKKRNSKIQN